MSKSRLELNHDGLDALLKSQEIKEYVLTVAEEVQARCGSGYEIDSHMTPSRVVSSVYTATAEASADNLSNNTLLKAVSG